MYSVFYAEVAMQEACDSSRCSKRECVKLQFLPNIFKH